MGLYFFSTPHEGEGQSLPGHLGSALPGSDPVDKGLPQADRREPLASGAEAGSHLAGDQAGGTLPGSLPRGERTVVDRIRSNWSTFATRCHYPRGDRR